jgi:hypothetical protein
LLIQHDDYSFPGLWALPKAYKAAANRIKELPFHSQLNTLSKTNNTMSAVPAFSFATTAEEVATAFSEEIRGKNGIFFPCFRR